MIKMSCKYFCFTLSFGFFFFLICLNLAFGYTNVETTTAVVRVLNKQSGKSDTLRLKVGQKVKVDGINILPRVCYTRPSYEKPENSVFLEIQEENTSRDDSGRVLVKDIPVFSGWMFSSSPSLSAMDNAVYDVWLVDCEDEAVVEQVPDDQKVPVDNIPDPVLSTTDNNL